jgi:predicted nucleotidyltransferase
MIPEIETNRAEIIAICEEFGVEQLDVFGSAASGTFDSERSDVDFLIVYPEGFDYGPWGERVDELKDRLSQVLQKDVDLVVLRWIDNPYVKRSIERQRVPIYAR